MEIGLLQNSFTLRSNYTKNTKKTNPAKVELKLTIFFTINEIKICNRIKTIPYYFNYFQVVTTHQLMTDLNNVAEIINKEDCRNLSLLSYNNEHGDDIKCLKDVLLQCTSPKQVILSSIDTYFNILNSLLLLHNNKITFFDMTDDNIYFTDYHKPIVKQFENSILYEHLDEKYISRVIKHITDFTYKPLEVHLLFYLIVNDEVSLSYALSYEICEHFIKNMPVLSLFSPTYRENFKKECNDFLTPYINRSRSDIINDVIKYYDTWDNYSLSILYLHIFAAELQAFSLNETFIGELINSLSKNLSIDPLKRETLSLTLLRHNNLMNTHTDWSYINKIPQSRLTLLHNLL
jgi:hypothetical protein